MIYSVIKLEPDLETKCSYLESLNLTKVINLHLAWTSGRLKAFAFKHRIPLVVQQIFTVSCFLRSLLILNIIRVLLLKQVLINEDTFA